MDPAGDPRGLRRDDFPVLRAVPTRWSDDDTYGHVNNVVHYLMFDTAVNGWLIEASGTDIRPLPAIGVVVETSCRYFAELRFPETVTAGIALERLGTSSVMYRLALFGQRDEEPAAVGRFVHVYVDAISRRPVTVPEPIRAALNLLTGEERVTETVFTYGAPELKFGPAPPTRSATTSRQYGVRRVLVVTDPGVAATGAPAAGRRRRSAPYGIEAEVFDRRRTSSRPTLACRPAVEAARAGGPWDAFVAVGGGSSIDTAKAVNLLTTNPGELMDYLNPPVGGGRRPASPLKPLVAVPTTTGTGSESTTVCVLDVLDAAGQDRDQPRSACGPPSRSSTRCSRMTQPAGGDRRARDGHPLPRAGELHRPAVHRLRPQDAGAAGAVLRRRTRSPTCGRSRRCGCWPARSGAAVHDGDDVAARDRHGAGRDLRRAGVRQRRRAHPARQRVPDRRAGPRTSTRTATPATSRWCRTAWPSR